jgi:hypothetical protein
MNYERPEENSEAQMSEPQMSKGGQASGDKQGSEAAGVRATSDNAAPRPATVLVRGETIEGQSVNSPPKNTTTSPQQNSARKPVSEAKVKMQSRLPALDDDRDIGVPKEHIVVRDGKADLVFTGTLLASAAPSSAPNGHWEEYRVYETSAGKHVFSKITRRVLAEEHDDHKAEIFDPSPSSMPAQLLKSARDLTHTRPKTWTDEAVEFFGYDPLAKVLYRKLGNEFEEHVS